MKLNVLGKFPDFFRTEKRKEKNEQYLLFESHIEALTFDMFSADYLTAKMFKLFKKNLLFSDVLRRSICVNEEPSVQPFFVGGSRATNHTVPPR